MCKYTKIMAEYKSKTVIVNQPQTALFYAFTNLEALLAAVPGDKRENVKIEGDTITTSYAGFTVAVRLAEKHEFSKVVYQDADAPFHFTVTFHFDPAPLISQTSLTIAVSADLNFMMRAMLGTKIQEALDQTVLAIANGGYIQQ